MIFALISQTILLVLLLTFSFGPAFFALINIGIKYGYRVGSWLAIGVVLSDFLLCMLMIKLVSIGSTSFMDDPKTLKFMGVLAGVILIVFGSLYLRKPVASTDAMIEISAPSLKSMLLKGLLLNTVNPSVWLLWLTYVTNTSQEFSFSNRKLIIYFGSVLLVVLMIEFAKVSLADKLKRSLTHNIMHKINVITGILLMGFGLVLIYKYYFASR